MENPGEHLEQAEQAQEAASDPFNRRVTLSIAMVAAVLAAVSMFGQNADNDALLNQGEALQHQIDAAVHSGHATNKWNQYQANNVRSHMYKNFADFAALTPGPSKEMREKIKDWNKKHKEYEETRLPAIKAEAEKFQKEMEEAQEEAKKSAKESQTIQARADRFDFGELGLQLGVVLCSLAILTRNKNFWAAGLTTSLIGILFALSGLFGLFISAD